MLSKSRHYSSLHICCEHTNIIGLIFNEQLKLYIYLLIDKWTIVSINGVKTSTGVSSLGQQKAHMYGLSKHVNEDSHVWLISSLLINCVQKKCWIYV